ncbi:serine acetyltransferase [Janibacter sp. YIM B02568]|nr:serine acetyltransferase [Janibacter endophyticus]
MAPATTRALIDADARRFSEVYRWGAPPGVAAVVRACGHRTPEFRNIFYYRLDRASLPLKVASHLVRRFYPGQCTLFVRADEIGPGLFIQHGFATTIGAARIGKNCWINQQVTIGHVYDRGAPTIGDDVTISAGAVVVGGISVGDGARIGANTTVVKDVPPGMIAVGMGMRLIEQTPEKTP